MTSRSSAHIVLLAKSRKGSKYKKFKNDLLSEIYPTEIPREFVSCIEVFFNNQQSVQFDCDKLTPTFTMEQLKKWLSTHDTRDGIKVVEITLDLDKVYETLQHDTESILSKYFSE